MFSQRVTGVLPGGNNVRVTSSSTSKRLPPLNLSIARDDGPPEGLSSRLIIVETGEELKSLNKRRPGGASSIISSHAADMASLSRRRRDLALAGESRDEKEAGIVGGSRVLPQRRAFIGAQLKDQLSPSNESSASALPRTGSLSTVHSISAVALPLSPSSKADASDFFATMTLSPGKCGEVISCDDDADLLHKTLSLREAEIERLRLLLLARDEELEGLNANLNVSQAELKVCLERLRCQSPTLIPAINLPRSGPVEVAQHAAAWAVTQWTTRAVARIQSAALATVVEVSPITTADADSQTFAERQLRSQSPFSFFLTADIGVQTISESAISAAHQQLLTSHEGLIEAAAQAREELRRVKVGLAKAKDEAAFHAESVQEMESRHLADVEALQSEFQRQQCSHEKEMQSWKKHHKREMQQDPILSEALRRWDAELISVKARMCFYSWRQQTFRLRQVLSGVWRRWDAELILVRAQLCFYYWRHETFRLHQVDTLPTQLLRVATLHICMRAWTEWCLSLRAESLGAQLERRWESSMTNCLKAWGMHSAKATLDTVMHGWKQQVELKSFQKRVNKANVQFDLVILKWGSESTYVVLHVAIQGWRASIAMTVREAFQAKLKRNTSREEAFDRAALLWGRDLEGLNLRIYVHSWAKVLLGSQVERTRKTMARYNQIMEKSALALMAGQDVAVLQLVLHCWNDSITKEKVDALVAQLHLSKVNTAHLIQAAWDWSSDKEAVFRLWKDWVALERRAKELRELARKTKFERVVAFCTNRSAEEINSKTARMAIICWSESIRRNKFTAFWSKEFKRILAEDRAENQRRREFFELKKLEDQKMSCQAPTQTETLENPSEGGPTSVEVTSPATCCMDLDQHSNTKMQLSPSAGDLQELATEPPMSRRPSEDTRGGVAPPSVSDTIILESPAGEKLYSESPGEGAVFESISTDEPIPSEGEMLIKVPKISVHSADTQLPSLPYAPDEESTFTFQGPDAFNADACNVLAGLMIAHQAAQQGPTSANPAVLEGLAIANPSAPQGSTKADQAASPGPPNANPAAPQGLTITDQAAPEGPTIADQAAPQILIADQTAPQGPTIADQAAPQSLIADQAAPQGPTIADQAAPRSLIADQAAPQGPTIADQAAPRSLIADQTAPQGPTIADQAAPRSLIADQAAPQGPTIADQAAPQSLIADQTAPQGLPKEAANPLFGSLMPSGRGEIGTREGFVFKAWRGYSSRQKSTRTMCKWLERLAEDSNSLIQKCCLKAWCSARWGGRKPPNVLFAMTLSRWAVEQDDWMLIHALKAWIHQFISDRLSREQAEKDKSLQSLATVQQAKDLALQEKEAALTAKNAALAEQQRADDKVKQMEQQVKSLKQQAQEAPNQSKCCVVM